MARRVLAAAEPFAHLGGLDIRAGYQSVEYARFADAGIARKRGYLAAQQAAQLVHALARHGARAYDGEARGGKDVKQLVSGVDIRFVHADGKLAIGFRGDDRDAVDKERVSHRIGIRRDEHKHIDVRYRGADEPVPPRLHMVDAAFPVRVETAADPVAHQR